MDPEEVKRRIRELRRKIEEGQGGSGNGHKHRHKNKEPLFDEKTIKKLTEALNETLKPDQICRLSNIVHVAEESSDLIADLRHLIRKHQDPGGARLALAVADFGIYTARSLRELAEDALNDEAPPEIVRKLVELKSQKTDIEDDIAKHPELRRDITTLSYEQLLGLVVKTVGPISIPINDDEIPRAQWAFDPMTNDVDIVLAPK